MKWFKIVIFQKNNNNNNKDNIIRVCVHITIKISYIFSKPIQRIDYYANTLFGK